MRGRSIVGFALIVFVIIQGLFVVSLYRLNALNVTTGLSTNSRGVGKNTIPVESPTPSIDVVARQTQGNSNAATPCPSLVIQQPVSQPPVEFTLSIIVFTYNRLNGLQTLLRSLLEADYLGRKDIRLHVFFDFPKKSPPDSKWEDTRQFLDSFVWPHGPFDIHRRLANAGLKKTITESWYPTGDKEVAAFFEDDIEVSPLWFAWMNTMMKAYFVRDLDPHMLGLSLFRPIKDELSGHEVPNPSQGGEPFLLQQPCSWGAVYFPKPWRAFRNWYDHHREESPSLVDPSNPRIRPSSNTWDSGSSWKKYLIKLMYEEGWFMVYPNFPNRQVLATNHLLPGVHPTPPKKLFELPLVPAERDLNDAGRRSLTSAPLLTTMRTYDVMFDDVGRVDQLHGYRR